MKKFFKKSTSIVLVLVTLLNMFLEPICVLASEAKAGDLRLVGENTQYTSEVGGSVSAIEGNFEYEGDVEIKKTVTKLDNNGNYEVKFEARGKKTSKTTINTVPIYAVIVFDRSNSMTYAENKWSNAKTAARTFAENLIEKYSNANIAMVTFGTEAQGSNFVNNNLKNISDNELFGSEPDGGRAGGTNLHAGLMEAKTLLQSAPTNAKKYIVVILAHRPHNAIEGKEFIVKASEIIYQYMVK